MKVAWTIAGSDSGGGAGVQADLHTFRDFGLHGATVVTCVTAQNSIALTDNHVVPSSNVRAQIQALAGDLPPNAIKIGALGSAENAAVVINFLDGLGDRRPFVVWDPVRQATVGGELGTLPDDTVGALLRAVDAVTPNEEELAVLGGTNVPQAVSAIRERGPKHVFITGGHGPTPGRDYWFGDTKTFSIQSDAIPDLPGLPGNGAHGGGCSLSSALAAARVQEDEDSSPVLAHMYVRQGLRALAASADAPGAGRPALPHLGWPGRFEDLPKVVDAGKELPNGRFTPLDQPLGLYAVVPDVDWLKRCVDLGLDTVQLRVKDIPSTVRRRIVAESIEATRDTATRLFVNDYWREAVEAGAYGVHLGQEDLTDADLPALARAGIRLGISTHSYYEIARAHACAPSYIAIGPIYATTTKPMKFDPQGLDRLRRWVELLKDHYPLTAIGGIDTSRAPGIMATGVDSIAVVRAITEARNPAAAVAVLRAAMLLRASHEDPHSRCRSDGRHPRRTPRRRGLRHNAGRP